MSDKTYTIQDLQAGQIVELRELGQTHRVSVEKVQPADAPENVGTRVWVWGTRVRKDGKPILGARAFSGPHWVGNDNLVSISTGADSLTPAMRGLVKALNHFGHVDPVRDCKRGVGTNTIVALMTRGILRESRGGRYGIHYPATTPAQVWDAAHAEHQAWAERERDHDYALHHVATDCPATLGICERCTAPAAVAAARADAHSSAFDAPAGGLPKAVCINSNAHGPHRIAGTWRTECPGYTPEPQPDRSAVGMALDSITDLRALIHKLDDRAERLAARAALNLIETALRQ